MRAFTVLFLIVFLFLIFGAAAFSDLDLTPDNDGVVQGTSRLAPAIPLAPTPGVTHVTPLEAQPQYSDRVEAVAQIPAGGVPVTGGAYQQTNVAAVQFDASVSNPGVVYVPVMGIPVTGVCQNPYVVYYGDTLSRIARACGTSVAAILALNPSITNADRIEPGQVLWLYAVTAQPNVPVTGGTLPSVTVPVNPVVLNPALTPIRAGTTLQVSVNNFPPYTPVNIGIGRTGVGYQLVNSGITDAYGTLRTTAVVPEANNPSEEWVVMVVTTTNPQVSQQSAPFTISPAR